MIRLLTPFLVVRVNKVNVEMKHKMVIGKAKPSIPGPSESILASGIKNLIIQGMLTTVKEIPRWYFQAVLIWVVQKVLTTMGIESIPIWYICSTVNPKYLCQVNIDRNMLIINSTYLPIPSRKEINILMGDIKK